MKLAEVFVYTCNYIRYAVVGNIIEKQVVVKGMKVKLLSVILLGKSRTILVKEYDRISGNRKTGY